MDTNFGVIRTVEYFSGGQWQLISFRYGSASFEEKHTHAAGGDNFKITVKFKVSGFTGSTETHIRNLRSTSIIRLTDVNGWRVIVGTLELPVKIKIDRSIDGTPGSFRGHDVTVTWDSPNPASSESFI